MGTAHPVTVHHGFWPTCRVSTALRASEAAAVRIEDYADALRGHRVLHLVAKGNKPWPTDQRAAGAEAGLREADRTGVTRTGWSPASRKLQPSRGTSARIRSGTPRSPRPGMPASPCGTPRSWPGTPTRELPSTTTAARGNLDRHGVHFLTAYVARRLDAPSHTGVEAVSPAALLIPEHVYCHGWHLGFIPPLYWIISRTERFVKLGKR